MAFCSKCGTALPEDARFCPTCGKEVGAAEAPAGFARAQERPAPVSTSRPQAPQSRAGLILPAVIVLAVLVIGIVLWSQRDGTRPIAGGVGNTAAATETAQDTEKPRARRAEAPDETASASEDTAAGEPTDAAAGAGDATTAASLDSAFNADPEGARDRYAGPLTVSGIVATMVTPGSTPSLSLEGRTRFNFVLANFPRDYGEDLANLAKGDRVTVSCRGVTALAGTTVLQGCTLE